MGIVYLTCSPVNDAWKLIADPVNKELLAGLALLRKNHLLSGSLLPLDILGTESAVAVSIGIIRAVFFLPDILEIDPLTGLEP